MAGDEIVVVERVNECSFRSGKRSFIERFPSNLVRDRNEFGVQRFHALQF